MGYTPACAPLRSRFSELMQDQFLQTARPQSDAFASAHSYLPAPPSLPLNRAEIPGFRLHWSSESGRGSGGGWSVFVRRAMSWDTASGGLRDQSLKDPMTLTRGFMLRNLSGYLSSDGRVALRGSKCSRAQPGQPTNSAMQRRYAATGSSAAVIGRPTTM